MQAIGCLAGGSMLQHALGPELHAVTKGGWGAFLGRLLQSVPQVVV